MCGAHTGAHSTISRDGKKIRIRLFLNSRLLHHFSLLLNPYGLYLKKKSIRNNDKFNNITKTLFKNTKKLKELHKLTDLLGSDRLRVFGGFESSVINARSSA